METCVHPCTHVYGDTFRFAREQRILSHFQLTGFICIQLICDSPGMVQHQWAFGVNTFRDIAWMEEPSHGLQHNELFSGSNYPVTRTAMCFHSVMVQGYRQCLMECD